MWNIKKNWKESKSILSKVRREAEKTNPQKLLLTDIVFGLVMISFLILMGITLTNLAENGDNFNLVEKSFIVLSTSFSGVFLFVTYLLVIKGIINKNKILKK